MRFLRRMLAKILASFFRGRAEREMAREIQSHLALVQEDFERRGLSAVEARLAALRSFGGVEQAKELHRGERSFLWIGQTAQDLRHALRGLARSPGFTFTAIIALALGIGVNTTLFSLFNAVALKPLPVSDPGHVVRFERWFESRARGNVQYGFSYPEYIQCRDHAGEFSSLVAASWLFGARTSPSGSRIDIQLVSANYFSDLGIPLALGRGFHPDEGRSPDAVAVLSYPYWQRAFHGDPAILGQALIVNGTAFAIVGITREEFTGTSVDPQTPDLWAPLSMQAQLVPGMDWPNQPNTRLLEIFGRLKPSALRQTAQAQADVLIRQFDSTLQENERTNAVTLQRTTYFPNVDDLRFQALVSALMLIVGLVLFVACANVGNMMLARGAARQREIGTRLALGASRTRVVRQLLAESVLVSFLGGAAALLLSFWTTKLLAIAFQSNATLIGGKFSAVSLTLDLRVMAYVAAISLAAGMAFGITPALQFSKPDIASTLKDEGGSLGHLRGGRLRSFLVAVQATVSVLLLAIAGLLARGLVRSRIAEPGFDTHSAFVVAANFAAPDAAQAVAREKLLLERLRQRPEFAAVALGTLPLLGGWTPPIIAGSSRGRTIASFASDGYFDLLRIPLLRGRAFTVQEAASDSHLAVISESTARRFFPGEDPLGKYLMLDMDFRGHLADFEVIGIAKDVRFANLTRIDPAHVYLPAGTRMGALFLSKNSLLLRIQGSRERAFAAVESTVEAFDRNLLPDLRIVNLEDGIVTLQRAMSRGFTLLGAVLASLSLTLAGIGIYGVIAYLVGRRTREIGIRIALGATNRALVRNVVLPGLRPVFVGTALGLVAAAALSWMLHATLVFPGSMDFLYGVPFYDPATFLGLTCFVLGIAAVASSLPARRAMSVDPLVALRYE